MCTHEQSVIDCLEPEVKPWSLNVKPWLEKSEKVSMAKKRALESESEASLRKKHDRAIKELLTLLESETMVQNEVSMAEKRSL